jgi:hypothetical protein
MANRKASTLLQIGTVAALAAAWLWARTIRSPAGCAKEASPYCIPPKRYALFSVLLLAADIYAIPAILRGKGLIDEKELADLSSDLVRGFDRHALSFTGSRYKHYQRISDNVLKGLVALPFLLLLDGRIRANWQSMLALYAWTHALTYTIYSFSPLGPAFVDKYRPIVYYQDLPETIRNLGNNRNARFSGHTANGACAAFFMAKVYNDFYPSQDDAAKYGRYLLAYTAPILLGWLRTKALKHFPSDVLQAILIGGTCGIMIPQLYKKAK